MKKLVGVEEFTKLLLVTKLEDIEQAIRNSQTLLESINMIDEITDEEYEAVKPELIKKLRLIKYANSPEELKEIAEQIDVLLWFRS